jgi:hypothetical protein
MAKRVGSSRSASALRTRWSALRMESTQHHHQHHHQQQQQLRMGSAGAYPTAASHLQSGVAGSAAAAAAAVAVAAVRPGPVGVPLRAGPSSIERPPPKAR